MFADVFYAQSGLGHFHNEELGDLRVGEFGGLGVVGGYDVQRSPPAGVAVGEKECGVLVEFV